MREVILAKILNFTDLNGSFTSLRAENHMPVHMYVTHGIVYNCEYGVSNHVHATHRALYHVLMSSQNQNMDLAFMC